MSCAPVLANIAFRAQACLPARMSCGGIATACFRVPSGSRRPVIRAVSATGAAAASTLQVIGRCEDHVRPVEIIVFSGERGRRCRWFVLHLSIFAHPAARIVSRRNAVKIVT